MAHIALREGLPRITSAFAFRPETAKLATHAPKDPGLYDEMGARMAEQGYLAPVESAERVASGR
jgi:hypothetical protein